MIPISQMRLREVKKVAQGYRAEPWRLLTEFLVVAELEERSSCCSCHTPSLPSSSPGLQVEFINPIFEFSRAMNELQLNDAEFALLIAISIFSAGAEEGQERK